MDFLLNLPFWFKLLLGANVAWASHKIMFIILKALQGYLGKASDDSRTVFEWFIAVAIAIFLEVTYSIFMFLTVYFFFKLVGAL